MFKITSDQGATVRRIADGTAAATYIRTLIAAGKSYSVETETYADKYAELRAKGYPAYEAAIAANDYMRES